MWRRGELTGLSALEGDSSFAFGCNEAGVISESTFLAPCYADIVHGVRWRCWRFADLETIVNEYIRAVDATEAGVVHGPYQVAGATGGIRWVWELGKRIGITTPDDFRGSIFAINESGEIVSDFGNDELVRTADMLSGLTREAIYLPVFGLEIL